MPKETILITGGAGLIGSHTADLFVKKGYGVRILDNLEKPTHPHQPGYINPETEFVLGDIRDRNVVKKVLKGVDGIIHLAATGGFTNRIAAYFETNSVGTSLLFEELLTAKRNVKVVTASSIAIYGEGAYRCPKHGKVYPSPRPESQLKKKQWETKCSVCTAPLRPLPTPEEKPAVPLTAYGCSKYDQERLTLLLKQTSITATALRYFVTYGPRQSPTNPYTGVCSLFSNRISAGEPPLIYEDGLQTRDFISVRDVARANFLAWKSDKVNGEVFNVGTGKATTIIDLAKSLLKAHGSDLDLEIPGTYRSGEVRHMVADASKIKKIGFDPTITLDKGIKEFVEWWQHRD